MIKSRTRMVLMALFCSVFLAACAESCGSGDMDEATSEAMTEEHADAADEAEATADEAADAAEAAAGEAAAAAEDVADATEETADAMGAGVDSTLKVVKPREMDMSSPPMELTVGEVALPDYGWRLRWFGTNDINQDPGVDITLRFAGGRLTGYAGCNQYNGSYDVEADRTVSVGEIATTRMACPDEAMSTEQRYLSALKSVKSYEFKQDGLYLYDAAGDWLHFYPEPHDGE
jgi:putative lipoprotein